MNCNRLIEESGTTSRKFRRMRGMTVASQRLIDARRELTEASEALDREPERQNGDTAELMECAGQAAETDARGGRKDRGRARGEGGREGGQGGDGDGHGEAVAR
jgi:hypothetical protein